MRAALLLALLAACETPTIPCSAVIDNAAFLRKMSDPSMATAVATCERDKWPSDAKKCLVEATSTEALRTCAVQFHIPPGLGGT